MAEWGGLIKESLEERFSSLSNDEILENFSWVVEVNQSANKFLTVDALDELSPGELYENLSRLSIPGCKLRITNLGKANDAERIKESLIKLLSIQGGFEEKFRGSKFPQAGIVTVSEILCILKPHRFFIRNTAFINGLAKVVPFYGKRALSELSYNDLYDICNELAKVMGQFFSGKGLHDFATRYKFLLLYAVLTG